jgi:hypothetical protein
MNKEVIKDLATAAIIALALFAVFMSEFDLWVR